MAYVKWLRTAAVFQFITAFVHTLALLLQPPPGNETEKQLFNLMTDYKFNFGAGFHRSMSELTFALSACFSLVCLLGGLMNWYLLKKNLQIDVMNGVITINLVVFTICFGLMATFTFLPPIILSGFIFLFLVIAKIAITKTK